MRNICILLIGVFIFLGTNITAQEKYKIYPIPQEKVYSKSTVSFTPVVYVVSEPGIDTFTCNRLRDILHKKSINAVFTDKPKGGSSVIYLGINGSGQQADSKATRLRLKRDLFSLPKFDKHIVSLYSLGGKAQLVILGEHTDAVFYGLATLEQMLDKGTGNLPCVTFYDYADVQYRGVIEGYYGLPYSLEVTEDLFRFMSRYKLNMYMYGAKSDPYHSRYWDKAYPTQINEREKRFGLMTQDMMKQLCDVANKCKVNFIWSIHPGQSFTELGESDVLDRIMSKFELMYKLGVRQFGVFVDDVGVPYDDPTLNKCANNLTTLQVLIDQKWNTPGTDAADMVKPLQYVPQLYAYSWVKPELAQKFWQSLRPVPEKVNIYTTGKNVWSVPNSTDLKVLNGYLGRPVSWWWNYPCNDVDITKIFVGDTYTNFADETHIDSNSLLESDLSVKTVIINPMQQGALSKIALFSVGDYTWNMSTFNNMASWKESLNAVLGSEKAPVFESIVPYLRYYDAKSPLASLIEAFKADYSKNSANVSGEALKCELKRIINACEVIETLKNSNSASDTLFYADIRPWLLKLKSMATNADAMVSVLLSKENTSLDIVQFAKCWSAIEGVDKNDEHRFDILRGMGSDITLSVQTAKPAAESLKPFIDWLLKAVEEKYK